MQTNQVESKSLYERYSQAGLVQPQFSDYENDFERQLFFAINLLRSQPKKFIPAVQRAYRQCSELKNSKSMKDVIKALKESEPLPLVSFDDAANQAVRDNNKEIVEKNESVEALKAKPSAGNIAKYKEVNGESVKVAEASHYYYTGNSAEEFIVLILAQHFDKVDAAKLAPKKTLSQKEAEKKDAEKKEAGDKEGESLTPEEKEKEKDQVEADPSKAVISELGDGKIDGVSPLLDAEANLIGISNKAHQSALNSVQFLWVYKKTNALV